MTVSTHSRPKAAGTSNIGDQFDRLFQHTAARRRLGPPMLGLSLIPQVSTHSRPKAAGAHLVFIGEFDAVSTHSRPKAAGNRERACLLPNWFQHTAARRRLGADKVMS